MRITTHNVFPSSEAGRRAEGPAGGRSRNLYIGIDLHIDSDIQISSSALAPHPSCYQLNVACDLSERRLLISDFAGAYLVTQGVALQTLKTR